MTRAYNTATTQQNSGGAVAGVTAGKNAVINGGMDIWQRGTSISLAANAAVTYLADRWESRNTGAAQTITRQATGDTTNLPSIQYCLRYQRNSGQTSTAENYLSQCFESVNSIPFAGKTVTVSFYGRAGANYSPSGGNLGFQIYTGTGTDQNIHVGYTGATAIASSTANLTTTWQRFSVSGTVGTTATEITINFTNVPTGTAGANDYFEVTGVQLEVGSVATPFSRAGGTIAGELDTCQRYFQRYGTGAASLYVFGNLTRFTDGAYYGSTAAEMGIIYPVQFRTSPTLSTTGTWKGWTGSNHNSTGTLSIQAGTNSNAMLRVEKSSGSWTTDYGYIASEDGGYVNFSAEL